MERKVQHDHGCPFCGGTIGTVIDEGCGAVRVVCDGCRAEGPRDWEDKPQALNPVLGWRADVGRPKPMWCRSCDDVIGDATFDGGRPVTVKFKAHAKCGFKHEVSCCAPARSNWTEATVEQITEALGREVARFECSDCKASYFAQMVQRDSRWEIGPHVNVPEGEWNGRRQRMLCGDCQGRGGIGDLLNQILRQQRGY